MFKKTLLAVSILLPVGAFADTFTLTAPVSEATLYFDGGDLVREASLEIPTGGEHSIRIMQDNLSELENVEIDGATLLSITKGVETKDLQFSTTEIALKRAEHDLDTLLQTIENYENLGERLGDSVRKNPEKVDFIITQLEKVQEKIATLRRQVVEKENVVSYLSYRLEHEMQGKDFSKGASYLELRVQTEKIGSVTVKLYEHNDQVAWHPSSVINLDTKESTIHFNAHADIEQNTSTDWHNVLVRLAVTPPQDYILPEWYSEVLHLETPIGKGKAYADMVVEESAPMAMAADKRSTSGEQVATIEATGMDFRVTLPHKLDIQQGGGAHVSYWQGQAPAEVYSAVYQWSLPTVIAVAEWVQPAETAFFAGSAQIKRDNVQIGWRKYDTPWQTQSAQKLSFGEDNTFSVEKIIPPEFTSKVGMIGKQNVRQVREEFSIKANRESKRELRLYARLPSPSVEEIEVAPKWSQKPTLTEVDGHKDFVMWKIGVLRVGKPWQLTFGYDIKYPVDKEIW